MPFQVSSLNPTTPKDFMIAGPDLGGHGGRTRRRRRRRESWKEKRIVGKINKHRMLDKNNTRRPRVRGGQQTKEEDDGG
jgi:hypothetical protein